MERVVVGLNAITRKWLRNQKDESTWIAFDDDDLQRFDPPLAENIGSCCALSIRDLELKCYRMPNGHVFHEYPQRILTVGFEELVFLTLRTVSGEIVDGSLWDDADIERLVEFWPRLEI